VRVISLSKLMVPDDLWPRVKSSAALEGLTLSQFVAQALLFHVEHQENARRVKWIKESAPKKRTR